MPTIFDTPTDRAYFQVRPWIEIARTQMTCTAEACGNTIDPGEEIVRDDDRGGQHVDCVLAEMLEDS